MPSPLHEAVATLLPRVRRVREIDTEPRERARVEAWHGRLDRTLPTRLVRRFGARFEVATEELTGASGASFPAYVLTPRQGPVRRTLYYLHGGGYMAPIDAAHVLHTTRLAGALGARVVLPDYPLAPEHTWRESHDALAAHAARWADTAATGDTTPMLLAGDSAGGGLALAVAMTLRDRGLPQPDRLVLHAPWVDLTTSTPETYEFAERDPWLFPGKLEAYARWWAGGEADLARPEVSPGLGDLAGLPRALMLYGTRDLLAPGCRLLRRRAAEAGWSLTGIEEPDLLHVYGLFPLVPEGERALRQIIGFAS